MSKFSPWLLLTLVSWTLVTLLAPTPAESRPQLPQLVAPRGADSMMQMMGSEKQNPNPLVGFMNMFKPPGMGGKNDDKKDGKKDDKKSKKKGKNDTSSDESKDSDSDE